MALDSLAARSPALVLPGCGAPEGIASGQNRGAAPAETTHWSGQSAEAQSADGTSARSHRTGDSGPREAAPRIQGVGDQIEGPRRDPRDRHLAQHALHRHGADASRSREADCSGSPRVSQRGPRGIDRFCRERLPTGAADPRQGSCAHLARGSRHQHHPQGRDRYRLGDQNGDRRLRER